MKRTCFMAVVGGVFCVDVRVIPSPYCRRVELYMYTLEDSM